MNRTNRENLERRFEEGEDVLDYFETDVVLTIQRLAELAPILNLSALAREAGINVQTLQAKLRRRTALTGAETMRLVKALRKHHLSTVA
jgi:hypothetical protein